MESSFIQFEMSEVSKESKLKRFAIRVVGWLLTRIIPKANPDFEEKISEVKVWLIECDAKTGFPEREIGLDQTGKAIVKMPFKKNYGYWIDNNFILSDFYKLFQAESISKEYFEEKWSLLI